MIRFLCVLALFAGALDTALCQAAVSGQGTFVLYQVIETRYPAISNEGADGTKKLAYPYKLTIVYGTSYPESVIFFPEWGASNLGRFPYALSSGQFADGSFWTEFGTVYQSSGNFGIKFQISDNLDFGPTLAEFDMTATIPANKKPQSKRKLRPKVKMVRPPSSADTF